MDIAFILAQVFAILGWIFLLLSYYREDIQKLLFIQIIAAIFDTASYALLGADAGLLICGFELVKAILYYKTDKDNLIFLVSLPVYAVVAWFSCQEEGLIALLPILGSVIDGFSLTRNKTFATIGGIVSSILWVIYDIVILAYSAAITDSIMIISNIFVLILGYSYILHINKLHIVRCRYISRHIYNNIVSLDRDAFSEEYLWSFDQHKDFFEINSSAILLIKDKNKTIGYINYIVINEDKYNRIKRAQTYYYNLNSADVTSLRKRRKNYILIESIAIKKAYESAKMKEFIAKRLRTEFRNKSKQGYHIYGIISAGVSDLEKSILSDIGFNHLKDYREKEELYELDEKAIKDFIK